MTKSLLIALKVSLAFSGTASAQATIEAGFDLLVVRPVQTFIDLNDLLPICPDATNGVQLPLQGVPLLTFPPAPGADLVNTVRVADLTVLSGQLDPRTSNAEPAGVGRAGDAEA